MFIQLKRYLAAHPSISTSRRRREHRPRVQGLEVRSLLAGFVDLGANVTVTAINSSAEAIGFEVGMGTYFRDSAGVMHIINPLPGDTSSTANGLNDSGQVVGYSNVSGGIGGTLHAFLYNQGTLTPLGTLGGDSSYAAAINDSGEVVGGSTTGTSGLAPYDAFLWSQATGMQDLTKLGFMGTPVGINSSGQIIAELGSNATSDAQPVLWSGSGDLINLPTWGGIATLATAINDGGAVVGWANTTPNTLNPIHAFLWSQTTGMQDLGTLSGYSSSFAAAINNSGVVVGYAADQQGDTGHAFIYKNGQMTDLNTYSGIPSGWVLNTATAINDNGVVAGAGTYE